jgi:hypothetical protein
MPPKHPLFRVIPPKEIILEIVEKLGIHIGQTFTRADLNIAVLTDILTTLEPYYFVCKAIDLFVDVDEKRLITILRQCLKVHNYQLKGRETTRAGRKVVNYIITKEENDVLEEPIIVSFN